MTKPNIPKSLLLKMMYIQNKNLYKKQKYIIKVIFVLWLSGFVAGYSLAMIIEHDDFFWYPFKKY
jgi:hypothetical protein